MEEQDSQVALVNSEPHMSGELQIVGRSSSHFTRVVLLYAELLGIPWRLLPVADLRGTDPAAYGGHPALKIPVLVDGGEPLFGALNICRSLAARATPGTQVTWTDEGGSLQVQNAQELVWHCMAAHVQLIMGTVLGKLPADNAYFVKIRAGLEGSLAWLDRHVDELLPDLLAPREINLLEVTLFCLVEHLSFRPTVQAAAYGNLDRFAQRFASLEAAQRTTYRFDRT